MRDDFEEKTMIGKRVKGYICLDTEKDVINESDYVFLNACESIALPVREDRVEEPRIFKVEGISQIKSFYTTNTERSYYICDQIRIIKQLTKEEILKDAMLDPSYARRLLCFYPITEKDAVILANAYPEDYFFVKNLKDIFENNEQINEIYEKCKKSYLDDSPKAKIYENK